jgi:signal transduction histidine kinase
MRLRIKFAVAIVCITVVLSASVYAGLEINKREAVEETHERVNDTAQLVADQIEASIQNQQDTVGLVASRPGARQFGQSDRFLDGFLDNSRFYAAQIVAANGTVISFRGAIDERQRQAVVGSNRQNEPYVRRPLDGEPYVGDLAYVNATDQHVLVFSEPIVNGSRIEGVLVGAMFLNEQTVFEVLRPLRNSSQRVTVVGGGMDLYATDQSFGASIRSSAPIESTGWTVTIERDRSALDARLNQLALFQGVELGLVVILMVGLGYWQYAVSLRQTERLLVGFDELGAGNYDYTVSLTGGTEWEQMSNGFNDLATTLRAREATLRERKQRLQVMYRVLRHNLRNEMSVILTYADLIRDLASDEQIAEAAATIDDAGRHLTDLSDRARQIETAIEADVERQLIDVTELVSEITADLDEQYPPVGITTVTPGEARAIALPSLRLAVESVVENACEHNDSPDPWVEVTVSVVDVDDETPDDRADSDDAVGTDSGDERPGATEPTGVRISVRDNGPGIPEQERTAIDTGRETALEHGSGLGIWLTYWVVDNSGGRLRFFDNEPRGSIVEIDLQRGLPPASEDGTKPLAATDPDDVPE